MKTPMQEHIEWLKEEIEAYALLLDVKKVEALTLAKEHAEQMLEKENFIIRQAYTYGYDDCGSKMPHDDKSFFNETFKTKEK
jgi:hypothetical protein